MLCFHKGILTANHSQWTPPESFSKNAKILKKAGINRKSRQTPNELFRVYFESDGNTTILGRQRVPSAPPNPNGVPAWGPPTLPSLSSDPNCPAVTAVPLRESIVEQRQGSFRGLMVPASKLVQSKSQACKGLAPGPTPPGDLSQPRSQSSRGGRSSQEPVSGINPGVGNMFGINSLFDFSIMFLVCFLHVWKHNNSPAFFQPGGWTPPPRGSLRKILVPRTGYPDPPPAP